MILIFLAVLVGFGYFVLIMIFEAGWNRSYALEPKGVDTPDTFVSVIVPCHNEEENIKLLISYIAQQSHQNFELIIVDDHSSDRTKLFARRAIAPFHNMKMIEAKGFGKKNALREGIDASVADLIVTIDGDCFPTFHWLEAIVSFQQKLPSDLLFGPVKMVDSDNFFTRVQSLEFISLIASGAGAAGARMPVFCNGANMAFTRKTWNKSRNELNDNYLSGDDVFLLHSVKKRNGIIHFIKSEAALVSTQPAQSLKEFIHQRVRWASKAKGYTDFPTISIALIVLLTALTQISLLVAGIFEVKFLIAAAWFFIFKFLLDFMFLSRVKNFFHLNTILAESLFLSVLYPAYIVTAGFSGLVFKQKKW